MKKRALLLLLILSAVLGIQGCAFPEKYPIEDLQNILIAGIDTDGENIVLTILVDTITSGGKTGEEQIGYKLYVSTGKTLYEAKMNFHAYTQKRISLYHLKYIVLGEQAARQGLDRLISYFLEEDETRFLHRLLVTRGVTAKEFLEQTNNESLNLADYLDSLFNEVDRTGKSFETKLLDYAICRERPWESLSIPTIQLSSYPEKSESGPGALAKLEGCAVFDSDRLIESLDGSAARGLNFVLNRIKNTFFTMAGTQGGNISVQIIQSHTRITPSFDAPLSAAVDVTVKFDLVEYQKNEDMFDDQVVDVINHELSAYIQKEIEQTLALLQQKQVDAAGIGDAFYLSNPVKWQQIKDRWPEVFAGLKNNVHVSAVMQNTYNTLNAIGK